MLPCCTVVLWFGAADMNRHSNRHDMHRRPLAPQAKGVVTSEVVSPPGPPWFLTLGGGDGETLQGGCAVDCVRAPRREHGGESHSDADMSAFSKQPTYALILPMRLYK